nr:uncharacterized protein K02A2.6-like [Hydra vulgaris]
MIFSRLGIPQIVQSDNGTKFTSSESQKFSKEWEFKHITSSRQYQQSNGMAERHVQIAKNLLNKAKRSIQDQYIALLEVKNTPVDGLASLAQLISGRRLRSTLPTSLSLLQVNPIDVNKFVKKNREKVQNLQKKYYEKNAKILENVSDGDCVRIHDGNRWQPGKIVESKQQRSFNVKTLNGNIVRRNRRHLLKTKEEVYWDVNLSDNESDMNESKDIFMVKENCRITQT